MVFKRRHSTNIFIIVLMWISLNAILSSCATVPLVTRGPPIVPVTLPFMRLEEAGECYFVDDFLPTPDSMVLGRSGGLYLRYYTYWNARYKFWSEVGIMLSFYSRDNRCWSLFEEYVLPRINESGESVSQAPIGNP